MIFSKFNLRGYILVKNQITELNYFVRFCETVKIIESCQNSNIVDYMNYCFELQNVSHTGCVQAGVSISNVPHDRRACLSKSCDTF